MSDRDRALDIFTSYGLAPERGQRLAAHAAKTCRIAGVPVEHTAHQMAVSYITLVSPHIKEDQ